MENFQVSCPCCGLFAHLSVLDGLDVVELQSRYAVGAGRAHGFRSVTAPLEEAPRHARRAALTVLQERLCVALDQVAAALAALDE